MESQQIVSVLQHCGEKPNHLLASAASLAPPTFDYPHLENPSAERHIQPSVSAAVPLLLG